MRTIYWNKILSTVYNISEVKCNLFEQDIC